MQRAFTLLELLIVLLIIGILIAIGLYRYQSVVETGYDKEAQSALRAAFINAEAVKTTSGSQTYTSGVHPAAINDLVGKLNNKSDGLTYIAWTDQEPVTTGLTPNFTGNDHKQILTSVQPGNTMVAFCNKSKSKKAYCVGTSETNLATPTSFLSQLQPQFMGALNVPFTSSSHATNIEDAYCALGTPTGALPRGCGDSGVDNTEGTNQHGDGTEGWFGTGNTNNESGGPSGADYSAPTLYQGSNITSYYNSNSGGSFLVPITGGTRTQLPGANSATSHKMSPDGTKVMVLQYPNLMIYDVSDVNQPPVVFNDVHNNFAWAPSGDFIVSQRNPGSGYQIYSAPATGGSWVQVTSEATAFVSSPKVSDDGAYLIYKADNEVRKQPINSSGAPTSSASTITTANLDYFVPSGNYVYYWKYGVSGINRVNFDGTDTSQISPESAFDNGAGISPDGSRLAFFNTADNYDLYVIDNLDTQTPSVAKKVVDMAGASSGRIGWSSDSTHVVYMCQYSDMDGFHRDLCYDDVTVSVAGAPTVVHSPDNSNTYVSQVNGGGRFTY